MPPKQKITDLIDLYDPSLFGSETADTEDPRDLEKYFVESPIFSQFLNLDHSFGIAQARKGVGKSALLKYAMTVFEDSNIPSGFYTGGNLMGFGVPDGESPNELLQDWQEILCRAACEELADQINTPKTAVELAILRKVKPFSKKTGLRAIASHIKLDLPFISSDEISNATAFELLKALIDESDHKIALFIDDIDATFKRSDREQMTLGAFFTAARLLSNSIDGLWIRTSVRKDVWTSLSREDEALDKCEQHITGISWSNTGTLKILANRIRNHINNREQNSSRAKETIAGWNDNKMIEAIFVSELKVPDLKRIKTVRRVLHRLSAGRPRWALQLCKMVVKEALKRGQISKLTGGGIQHVLPAYSRYRIGDIVKEHKHQCELIEDLIMAFDGTQASFSTTEILNFIEKRILKFYKINIDENPSATAAEVASFLYRTGFLEAVTTKEGKNEYMNFEEYPHFFKSLSADHSYVRWDINPSFVGALHL